MDKRINTRSKIIAIVSIFIFVILFVLIFWFAGKPIIRLVSNPEDFRSWTDRYGFSAKLAFIGMVVLQIVVAIIPGEPFEIGAGYVFGVFWGTVLCLTGAVIGSVLVFIFVRRFGRRAAEIFFSKEKINSLKFLEDSSRLNMLTFIIFLIPGTPKDLLCYFMGLTKMKLSSWICITAVSRIPSIITSTIGGNALGLKNYKFAVVVLGITLIISGIGLLIYNHHIYKLNKRGETKNGNN